MNELSTFFIGILIDKFNNFLTTEITLIGVLITIFITSSIFFLILHFNLNFEKVFRDLFEMLTLAILADFTKDFINIVSNSTKYFYLIAFEELLLVIIFWNILKYYKLKYVP